MKCKHCGSEVGEQDRFCGECGQKIDHAVAAAPPPLKPVRALTPVPLPVPAAVPPPVQVPVPPPVSVPGRPVETAPVQTRGGSAPALILIPVVLTFVLGFALMLPSQWYFEFAAIHLNYEISFYHTTVVVGLVIGVVNGLCAALVKIPLPKSFVLGLVMFFLAGLAMFSLNELYFASTAENYGFNDYLEWSLVPTLVGSVIIALLTVGIGRIARIERRPAVVR